MKIKVIFWLNIIFLIVVASFTLNLWLKTKKQRKSNPEIQTVERRLNDAEEYISLQPDLYEIAGMSVINQKVSTFDNDTLSLKTVNTVNPKQIYLYVSSIQCKDCINYVLSSINEINDIIGSDNFTILYSGFTPREMYYIKKENNYKNLFLEIIPNKCPGHLNTDYITNPILFFISQNDKLEAPYYPSKIYKKSMIEYLYIIKDKLSCGTSEKIQHGGL